jgi:hypothetical protein
MANSMANEQVVSVLIGRKLAPKDNFTFLTNQNMFTICLFAVDGLDRKARCFVF